MTNSLESTIHHTLTTLVPKIHQALKSSPHPLILGITGLQGSGKSTWASLIVSLLRNEHNLRAITISLDDVYKTHNDLIAQRDAHAENRLYRTRGQPGTHDERLAGEFFAAVRRRGGGGSEVRIPRFDKSGFGGEGERLPESEWSKVEGGVDVVVFEGWCVGFRALSDGQVKARWEAAIAASQATGMSEACATALVDHRLEHLLEVNANLRRYNRTFMGPEHFDFLVHLDTEDLQNVYHWRLQQEHAMIKAKGSGMTDEAVVAFVRGYMPAYELYLDGLREGFFGPGTERQVRVVLDREREVKLVDVI